MENEAKDQVELDVDFSTKGYQWIDAGRNGLSKLSV